jgi:predicted  nucleic acid-binding Zn ribbon protein
MNNKEENTENSKKSWTSVEDLGSGIFVYRNVITTELNAIQRLEEVLNKEGNGFTWQPAYVGYQQLMPNYRDCEDFKFKKTDIESDLSEDSVKLQELWQDCYDRQKLAVDDYQRRFNIGELR